MKGLQMFTNRGKGLGEQEGLVWGSVSVLRDSGLSLEGASRLERSLGGAVVIVAASLE